MNSIRFTIENINDDRLYLLNNIKLDFEGKKEGLIQEKNSKRGIIKELKFSLAQ